MLFQKPSLQFNTPEHRPKIFTVCCLTVVSESIFVLLMMLGL